MEEMLDMEGLAGWGWKVPIVDRSEAGCKTLNRCSAMRFQQALRKRLRRARRLG